VTEKDGLEWNHPKGEDRYPLVISVFRLPDWVTFYELLLFLDRVRPCQEKAPCQPEVFHTSLSITTVLQLED